MGLLFITWFKSGLKSVKFCKIVHFNGKSSKGRHFWGQHDVDVPPVTTEAPVVVNDTEAVINGTTGKIPSTPEGMALAYSSLLIMALIPIVVGSFRSVKSHR